MPNTASQVVVVLAGLSGPSIPAAVRSRIRDVNFRPAAMAILNGRACSAADRAACIAATSGDASATANAIRLALDMTPAEAAKLPVALFRGPDGRAFLARFNGRGTTGAIGSYGS